MPASVSLSGLSWSQPDGTPLFTDLDLSFLPERAGIVGRNGTGKTTLLRLIAGELAPAAGHIRITGSVALMRQDVAARPDDTIADLFGVGAALDILARAEDGLADAETLAEADWTLHARIEAALLRLGLSASPHTRLGHLSGGQQSRAALAALVFAAPDFLLLDEPTNNLDRTGRDAVIALLRDWRGGAIIASHDRELLEEMDTIVELSALGALRYGGNYSAYRQRKDLELDAAARDLAHAEKTRADAARRARQAAERKVRKDSAGRRARAKGGQPRILLDAAQKRAESSGGAGARLREDRRAAADAALAEARDKVEMLQGFRMEIAPTGLAAGQTVLRVEALSGGHDPADPVIRDLSLQITGPERVVIAGPNGSGKTTLLRLIAGQIAPRSGTIGCAMPHAMLDQHLHLLAAGQTLQGSFRALHPDATRQAAHAALARFGFRAGDALRDCTTLSGGEWLRAGLACTLGAVPPPALLILDEPTNHLDIDGIKALEAALAGYDGAVLAVSHDAAFLDALAPDRVIELPPR